MSPVRYARVEGVSLAYQTWGEGPATIVAIPPMAQNIELMWERPEYRTMFDRLGSFARVLHFDKRGTGASDRTTRMPTIDERVEDVRAVMDGAGIQHAHLLGVSEGGPVALAFAATYPHRVDGVVLVSSGARVHGDATPEQVAAGKAWNDAFAERWGTEESMTLEVFAPTVATDPGYRAWEPRYERQSASPAAVRELLAMMQVIDVRPLLRSIVAPVLVLHRRGDRAMPIERAREVAAGVADARLVELDGDDHMPQVGDVHAWLDHVEAFTTGSVGVRTAPASPDGARAEIRTMGGFGVRVDGDEVPPAAWGSRQVRQLCKRLAVAAGHPVPREELMELLWPDELDMVRLRARLSVLLSHIRRVLGGGLIADRDAVAVDLAAVDLDLHHVHDALARGDDEEAVSAYAGLVLPEDRYEEWAVAARDQVAFAVIGAHRRLAARAMANAHLDAAIAHTSAILELDPYDERAHEVLVGALETAGRSGDAVRADERYRQRMQELGVRARDLLPRRGVAES
ncbi:MAG: alpha/beta fold hydrolase [Actinobacteria bacterium]|nr:alpha/beta fold hydrolase [Actinomycetota bacterium]